MKRTKTVLAAAVLGLMGAGLSSGVASAAGSVQYIGSGDTLRAILYEDSNFGGAQLWVLGNGPCTASTTDADFSVSVVPTGWNDRISSVKDFSKCDVNLYWNGNFGTPSTGYVNYSASGKNVPSGWGDKASSLRVS